MILNRLPNTRYEVSCICLGTAEMGSVMPEPDAFRMLGHCLYSAGVGTSADILRVPDGMPWQAAVCFDPCQFALCDVRDAHIKLGDAVCVMGSTGRNRTGPAPSRSASARTSRHR